MGQPAWSHVQALPVEHIDRVEGTRGTETSQYPEEEIPSPE
jgi:outer membrane cobalamin receptor